jgi:hypothetical protein
MMSDNPIFSERTRQALKGKRPYTPTDEECLRNEKVRALVEALTLWDAYDKSGEADGLALMLAYDAAITATRAALADLSEAKK